MWMDKIATFLLAGGTGERLRPLTLDRCKPAVPFGASLRVIDFTLLNCVLSGLSRVQVLGQYRSESLARHLEERWADGTEMSSLAPRLLLPRPDVNGGCFRGTADAVRQNLDLVPRRRGGGLVLVLSGDHVYRADYRRLIAAHLSRKAAATVLTGWVDAAEASAFGVLRLGDDGRILEFVEKPRDPSALAIDGRCCISLGVYCFDAPFLHDALAGSEEGTDFGRHIVPANLDARVYACPLPEVSIDSRPYWRDIGTVESYFAASMDLLGHDPAFSLDDARWSATSRFRGWLPQRNPAPARKRQTRKDANLVARGVEIGDSHVTECILSPGVRIGDGCRLHRCVVFPGAEIGDGVCLESTIVEEGLRLDSAWQALQSPAEIDATRFGAGITVLSDASRGREAAHAGFRTDGASAQMPMSLRSTDASRQRDRRLLAG